MFDRCAIAKEIAEDIERQKCSTDSKECEIATEITNVIIRRECSLDFLAEEAQKYKNYDDFEREGKYIYWHGTDSPAFTIFNPILKTKEEQFWNPLGNSNVMYVSNDKEFVTLFGKYAHPVIIPPTANILRITRSKWDIIGLNIVKKAYKNVGIDYWNDLTLSEKMEINEALKDVPYEGLYDVYIYATVNRPEIAEQLAEAIEKESTKRFSKYDVVSFWATNDPMGNATEVLIINKDMQKTIDLKSFWKATQER